MGSSDIGDVSHLVPTIHPYFQICKSGTVSLSPEFAAAAVAEQADRTLIPGATPLAWTGADVLLRPELRERMQASFKEQLCRDSE